MGDFSLDTQRVEVYSSFMGLTKSSAFWKSSSVNLSSPGQKRNMKIRIKTKLLLLIVSQLNFLPITCLSPLAS